MINKFCFSESQHLNQAEILAGMMDMNNKKVMFVKESDCLYDESQSTFYPFGAVRQWNSIYFPPTAHFRNMLPGFQECQDSNIIAVFRNSFGIVLKIRIWKSSVTDETYFRDLPHK